MLLVAQARQESSSRMLLQEVTVDIVVIIIRSWAWRRVQGLYEHELRSQKKYRIVDSQRTAANRIIIKWNWTYEWRWLSKSFFIISAAWRSQFEWPISLRWNSTSARESIDRGRNTKDKKFKHLRFRSKNNLFRSLSRITCLKIRPGHALQGSNRHVVDSNVWLLSSRGDKAHHNTMYDAKSQLW